PPGLEKILGTVLPNPHAAAAVSGLGNLSYHGGPVMLTNKTYAIYWKPSGFSVSSRYISLNNQFLADVAAASGQTSNVYWSGTQCAFSYFCAYHSWYGSGSTVTLYANQPYTMTVPSACDSGQHPNGDDADPTINVVSHEHNEAITDEQGNAWYDRVGYENGDK